MDEERAEIQEGMDVFGTDGEKLGRVVEVHGAYATGTGYSDSAVMTDGISPGALAAEARGDTSASGDDHSAGGVAQATYGSDPTPQGYFKMAHGGVFGIGAKEVYVPFSAVCDVAQGRCVTLSCDKDDCQSVFMDTPPDTSIAS